MFYLNYMELLLIAFLILMFFVCSGQPMVMVISLMIITSIYSFYIYLFMGSYWFSYALMLVVLSGIMVVFAYMAGLSPNESFEFVNMLVVWLFAMIIYSYKGMLGGDVVEGISLSLWISYISLFLIFLVSFLLVIMVMVVWLSLSGSGAIRVG